MPPSDPVRAEPLRIVELTQPRCSNRFGIAPCTASLARGPRCFNCFGSCLDLAAYNTEGAISWRFSAPVDAQPRLYEEAGDVVKTNPFPTLKSVSVRSAKINIAAVRDGEKPLGVAGGCTVSVQDHAFDDAVGDWYRAERGATKGNFWPKWNARNPFYGNMRITIYDGYAGQTLSEMVPRSYLLESVDGPDADGTVKLTGINPLRLTSGKKAKFPRETTIEVYADITATTTAVTVVAGDLADLTDSFGNAALSYVIIGSEILSYTGVTATDTDGRYALTGVVRGVLGTEAESHDAEDAVQRVGRYDRADGWEIAADLIRNQSPIPAEFVDADQWAEESAAYLQGYRFERTVTTPTAVDTLLGELMRDGMFFLWWDEQSQTIPLKAVRPELAQIAVTDEADIVAGTASITLSPDDRISRAFVYYGVIDPTKSDEGTNYRYLRGLIDADAENEAGGADVATKAIYSRWITGNEQALEMLGRLVARFSTIPRYLTLTLVEGAAKGADVRIGGVLDVTTRLITDTEGNPVTLRWQVIAAQQGAPGETLQLTLQEAIYQDGRYLGWMAGDAADYDGATAPDLSTTLGWLAGEDGMMPNGDPAYAWQ